MTSNSVTLTSPTVAEFKEMTHQLKRRQKATWSIKLNLLFPNILLKVLTDIK